MFIVTSDKKRKKEEKEAVKLFAIPVEDGDPAPTVDRDLSFADSLLRNGQDKKRRRLAASNYRSQSM